jgi:hypothetical protein
MAQEADTKTVKFDGVDYTVSTSPYSDLDVLEAQEDRRYSALAKALAGDDQYATFRKNHSKTEDLFAFIAALLGDDEDEAEDTE